MFQYLLHTQTLTTSNGVEAFIKVQRRYWIYIEFIKFYRLILLRFLKAIISVKPANADIQIQIFQEFDSPV